MGHVPDELELSLLEHLQVRALGFVQLDERVGLGGQQSRLAEVQEARAPRLLPAAGVARAPFSDAFPQLVEWARHQVAQEEGDSQG